MNLLRLQDIISNIKCEVGGVEWEIVAGPMGDGFYIQLRYIEPDIETGDPEDQHGRKWYISSHSTKSEVIQTILKACLTSAEHMIREHFTYMGQRIFSPHFDVDRLLEIASKTDTRDVRPFDKPEDLE